VRADRRTRVETIRRVPISSKARPRESLRRKRAQARREIPLSQTALSAASPRKAAPVSKARPNPEETLALVLARLASDKAEDTTKIDLKGKTTIADYMVVSSGRSHRHVGAIAEHLKEALEGGGVPRVRIEGLPHCDWVLIDAGDVIVHIFRPEVRAFYRLESMWARARPTPEA
jgi:ribosome-associated protein